MDSQLGCLGERLARLAAGAGDGGVLGRSCFVLEASLKNHYLPELSCGSGVTGGLGFEPLYSGGFWTKTLLGLQPSPLAVALASCSSGVVRGGRRCPLLAVSPASVGSP